MDYQELTYREIGFSEKVSQIEWAVFKGEKNESRQYFSFYDNSSALAFLSYEKRMNKKSFSNFDPLEFHDVFNVPWWKKFKNTINFYTDGRILCLYMYEIIFKIRKNLQEISEFNSNAIDIQQIWNSSLRDYKRSVEVITNFVVERHLKYNEVIILRKILEELSEVTETAYNLWRLLDRLDLTLMMMKRLNNIDLKSLQGNTRFISETEEMVSKVGFFNKAVSQVMKEMQDRQLETTPF